LKFPLGKKRFCAKPRNINLAGNKDEKDRCEAETVKRHGITRDECPLKVHHIPPLLSNPSNPTKTGHRRPITPQTSILNLKNGGSIIITDSLTNFEEG